MGRSSRRRKRDSVEAPPPADRPLPRRRPRALYALIAAVVAVALGALVAGGRLRGSGSLRREAGLNVLLITIDTLRADALGAYGNAAAQTPWLDRLAAG
ncbi:MAG TPA: hypothetical protein VII13_17290, partial [Vicinamibacteria bacterium]